MIYFTVIIIIYNYLFNNFYLQLDFKQLIFYWTLKFSLGRGYWIEIAARYLASLKSFTILLNHSMHVYITPRKLPSTVLLFIYLFTNLAVTRHHMFWVTDTLINPYRTNVENRVSS